MQMQVNLLPVQYRPKPAVRFWPILLTVVLMLNLIIISSYWLSIQLELSNTQASLSVLKNEVTTLQRRVAEREWKSQLVIAVAEKTGYINQKERASILWHPMLEAVERAMVPGVTILALNTSVNGDISIGGTTDSITSVANFLGSLQLETELKRVRLVGATPGGAFQITMTGWSGQGGGAGDE